MNEVCRTTMNNFYYHSGLEQQGQNTMLPSMESNQSISDFYQLENVDIEFAIALLEDSNLQDSEGGLQGDMTGCASPGATESPASTPSPYPHTPNYMHFTFPEPQQQQAQPQYSVSQYDTHMPLPQYTDYMSDQRFMKEEAEMSLDETTCASSPSPGPQRRSRADYSQDEGPDGDRRQRRRLQNRMAARRCRERKKQQRSAIIKEYYELVSANAELQSRIQRLEVERNRLHETLERHARSCSLKY